MLTPVSEATPISADGVFATTRWTVVVQAGADDSPTAVAAMESLCQAYWFPIYAHVRRRGFGWEEARDLTQDFFASLIKHDSIARVRSERGRFRTFLLASLDYFLADRSDHIRAAKRGSGKAMVELDALEAEQRLAIEPSTHETPDLAFDRRWISVLIERALESLQSEQVDAGRRVHFDLVKRYLEHDAERGDYETAAASLAVTPNAVAAMVRRLRLGVRELLIAEVIHTVGTPGEAEDELRRLLS